MVGDKFKDAATRIYIYRHFTEDEFYEFQGQSIEDEFFFHGTTWCSTSI